MFFKIYNTREINISWHVSFHEHILPTYPSNSSSITTNWDYFPSVSCSPRNLSTDISQTPQAPPPPFIDLDPPHHDFDKPISLIPPPILRRSSRTINPPQHLQDYICNVFDASFSSISSHVPYPISHYMSYDKQSPSHCAFSLSIASKTKPTSYVEASKFKCWKQAMKVELTALENTGTWKLVDLPPNVKPICCRWIYKIKHMQMAP